jgi:hypothetical protein
MQRSFTRLSHPADFYPRGAFYVIRINAANKTALFPLAVHTLHKGIAADLPKRYGYNKENIDTFG